MRVPGGRPWVVARRLLWGVRQVGLRRSALGVVRFLAIGLRKPSTVRCVTPSGLDIAFTYPSQMMPTLVLFGDLLEPEMGMLPRVLGPGAVAVDVGGAIGTWALTAARTGARVYCCEPDPENVASLEANIDANSLTQRMSVHRIGLGSEAGWGVLVPQKRRYLNRVRVSDPEPETGPADGGEPAADDRFPILTVDSFAQAQGLARIDVLKINTAGGEREVLEGCEAMLRNHGVTLLMVLDGTRVRPLLDRATAFGYEMGFWDGKAGRMVRVAGTSSLDTAPRGPMNRYVLLQLSDAPGVEGRWTGASQAR